VLDYQHKITTWLVREYDAVFVENLDVKGMLEQSGRVESPYCVGIHCFTARLML